MYFTQKHNRLNHHARMLDGYSMFTHYLPWPWYCCVALQLSLKVIKYTPTTKLAQNEEHLKPLTENWATCESL